VEIVLVERPVPRLGRKFVPGEPARLIEPEAVRVGASEIVQLPELAGTDAGIEVFGNGMNDWTRRPRLMSMTKR